MSEPFRQACRNFCGWSTPLTVSTRRAALSSSMLSLNRKAKR
ncbi:hypothetical protein [Lysobacter gummosus]